MEITYTVRAITSAYWYTIKKRNIQQIKVTFYLLSLLSIIPFLEWNNALLFPYVIK